MPELFDSLYDAIFRRISVRKYSSAPLEDRELDSIESWLPGLEQLFGDIDARLHLVRRGELIHRISTGIIGSYGKITAPHYIVATSVTKEGYLENTGFILEQAVLRLTSMGLGTCWIGGFIKKALLDGIIKIPAGHAPVIVVAFGRAGNGIDVMRKFAGGAKRKSMEHIALGELSHEWLDVAEAARLAPSAMNSQPWRFSTDSGEFHLFIEKKHGILGSKPLAVMNRIDAGIALAHAAIAAKHFHMDAKAARLDGIKAGRLENIKDGNMAYIASLIRDGV